MLTVTIHLGLSLYELIGKEIVTGKIIRYNHWITEHSSINSNSWITSGSRSTLHHIAPVALYTVDNIEYLVQGPEIIDTYNYHETGIEVPILYNKRTPAHAYFYTVNGFWFSHSLYWLIAFLVAAIAVTTFMEKSQLLILRYSSLVEGQVFELTPSEKPNWLKRNAGKVKLHYRDEIAKRQSLRKRRR